MLNKSAQLTDTIFTIFAPFILENNPRFLSDHVLEATKRLSDEERALFGYLVHELDWRHYWIDVHMMGLHKWAFSELDDRISRQRPTDIAQDLVLSLIHI